MIDANTAPARHVYLETSLNETMNGKALTFSDRLEVVTREKIISLVKECRERGKRIDLSGMSLVGNTGELDLSELDLRGAKLTLTKINNVSLYGSDLKDSDLYGSVLDQVDLRWTKLKGAKLDYICCSKIKYGPINLLRTLNYENHRLLRNESLPTLKGGASLQDR